MQDGLSLWRDVADDLSRRFELATTVVDLPGKQLKIVHPRSADTLISEEEFLRDERLPYWAEIWPAARALAGHVLSLPGAGKRCLELGSGLGLVSLAALRAGYDVIATDYYAEALEFTRFNAALNGLRVPQTRLVDWRAYPSDLHSMDLILAADVLYETQLSPLVVAAIDRSLSPGGLALVADPARGSAERFWSDCQQWNLAVSRNLSVTVNTEHLPIEVRLYEIRRANSE